MFVWVTVALYSSDPEDRRKISKLELTDILASRTVEREQKSTSLPYGKLVLSLPFWAVMTANMAAGYVTNVQSDYTPTYFKEILRFDLQQNGLLAALPCLLEVISVTFFGVLSDRVTIQSEENSKSSESFIELITKCQCSNLAVN